MELSVTAFGCLLIFIKLIVHYFHDRRRRTEYPPGPPGLPIIGNMFDVPVLHPGEKYVELGKKYNSDIIRLSVLGTSITVLNKREDADALLEIRSAKYSDRPVIPIVELIDWEYNTALLPYGTEWRLHRRLMQQSFRQAAVERAYYPIIEAKVHQMLRGLLETPHDFVNHNKMLSISVPMATMYGYDAKSVDDLAVSAADDCLDHGTRLLLPGASYINLFPALKHLPTWFPFFNDRSITEEVRVKTGEMKRIPLQLVKESMDAGVHKSSLVVDFFDKKAAQGAIKEEEEAVLNIAYTAYAGAAETTISATGSYFYFMAVNPTSQKRAQAEIDMVVGSNRLPRLEDRPYLPYVEAVYREVMRCCPPASLGLPHTVYEDDHYKGFFMPKGSQVLANIWAMAHDPDKYRDPDAFDPERFFNEDGTLNNDDRVLAYGFGRRICAGKYIASAQMWLMIACTLACFDIGIEKDEFGRDVEIDHSFFEQGFIRHKHPFRSSIWPRSEAARDLIATSQLNVK